MVSSAETTAQRVAVPSSLFNLPLILTLLKLLPIPGLHLKAERLGTVLYTFLFAVGVWGPSSHLLLPSIRSCSGVSCVGDPLAPAHTLLGRISISVWSDLLPSTGNCQYSPSYRRSILIWHMRIRLKKRNARAGRECQICCLLSFGHEVVLCTSMSR